MKYSVVTTLLVVVGALQPGLAFAYGINATQNGHHLRWNVDTVGFRLDPELEALLPEGQIRSAINMAFDSWRGLPRVPDLVLRPGEPESPGNHGGSPTNGIYLIHDWKGEPDQLAVTVVTYSSDTGKVLDADVLVNANSSYALLEEGGAPDYKHYDMGALLTHEAGHTLGLDESFNHPEATMWPRVNLGDTHQRSLSEDDEEGVVTNYAESLPDPALGCGSASVLGRPAQRGNTLLLAFAMLAGLAWLLRRREARRTLAFGLGAVLLAAPASGGSASGDRAGDAIARLDALDQPNADSVATLSYYAFDARPDVRLAAARALSRVGTPEQRDMAAALVEDADPDVADAARVAQNQLLARVPQRWLSVQDPAVRARLVHALGASADAGTLSYGHAHRIRAQWQDGFIVTQHAVRDASGHARTIEALGGEVDGVGQTFTDTVSGPVEGAEVVVGSDANGVARWAYHHDGFVFGGWLGDATPIRLP